MISTGDRPLVVSLVIKSTGKPYEFSTRTTLEQTRLTQLLMGIVTKSLVVKTDDQSIPTPPLRRTRVDKKGSFGMWHRRSLFLGSSSLLIFHDAEYIDLRHIVVVVDADHWKIAKPSDCILSLSFILQSGEMLEDEFVFRFDSDAECNAWLGTLLEVQREHGWHTDESLVCETNDREIFSLQYLVKMGRLALDQRVRAESGVDHDNIQRVASSSIIDVTVAANEPPPLDRSASSKEKLNREIEVVSRLRAIDDQIAANEKAQEELQAKHAALIAERIRIAQVLRDHQNTPIDIPGTSTFSRPASLKDGIKNFLNKLF